MDHANQPSASGPRTTAAPEPSNLEDFRALLTEHLLLIVVAVVVAVGISLAVTLRQHPQYDATATMSFSDSSTDATLVGVPAAPTQLASQVAAAGVTQVERTGVLVKVVKVLGSDLPGESPRLPLPVRQQRFSDRLHDNLSTSVQTDSNLVEVTVRWTDGLTAARLANLVATQTAVLVNDERRRGYMQRADDLRAKLKAAPRGKPGSAASQARHDYSTQISKLVLLSTLAEPAQVTSRAERVASPSSPRPVFIGALAGVIGLLVGVLLAVGRRAFDRRVRDVGSLEPLLGSPVIGDFPASVLGIAGPLVREHSARATVLVDRARVLRQNLAFLRADEAVHVVVVTSAVEGEGKSTVSSSLAVAAAAAGDRVLLVDADLRRPVVADRLAVDASPGLTEFLVGQADAPDVLRTVAIAEEEGASETRTIVAVPAGQRVPQPADLLDSERFRAFVQEVRGVYDLVIFDTAPLLPVPDTAAIVTQADAVVLCCRVNAVGRDAFVAARERLELLGVDQVAVAATGVTKRMSRRGGYAYDTSTYYGYARASKRRGRPVRTGRRRFGFGFRR